MLAFLFYIIFLLADMLHARKGVAGVGIKAFRSHQDASIQEVFLS